MTLSKKLPINHEKNSSTSVLFTFDEISVFYRNINDILAIWYVLLFYLKIPESIIDGFDHLQYSKYLQYFNDIFWFCYHWSHPISHFITFLLNSLLPPSKFIHSNHPTLYSIYRILYYYYYYYCYYVIWVS